MGDFTYPQAIAPAVAMLVNALSEVGLHATPFGGSMVWVSNPAAEPPRDNPLGLRMNPGLRQVVQLRTDDLGQWGWWWVWTAPGEMPTFEWIASDVETVVASLARVLAVRPEVMS
jgi:hypothetical protein